MTHWTPDPTSTTTPHTVPTPGIVQSPRPLFLGRILSFEDDI
jgi:hypothetical protein